MAALIAIIDDDPEICRILTEMVEQMGHRAESALELNSGLEMAKREAADIVLLDLQFPTGHGLDFLPRLIALPSRPEVIIITGAGDPNGAELAFKHGAWDYIRKPFIFTEVSLPIFRALQYRRDRQAHRPPTVLDRGGIIGDSPALMACLNQTAQAAVSEAPVMITGETGAGKELFARAIHRNSPRAKANFVVVDCAALPETLIETTLFGHVRGAFTGADRDHSGLINQADGGALFLDEIGELPLTVQKTFLRVLQERRYRPVGAKKEQASEFRLIAATNRDLDLMVKQNLFRKDLLFRLRAMEIHLPPLRDRLEDVRSITLNHLGLLSRRYWTEVKGVSPEFLDVLAGHDWPGNVRELLNTIEAAVAAAGPLPTLFPKHLPADLRAAAMAKNMKPDQPLPTALPLPTLEKDQFPSLRNFRELAERRYIDELLLIARGDRETACQMSGLSQSRLYALLKKYDVPRFRRG